MPANRILPPGFSFLPLFRAALMLLVFLVGSKPTVSAGESEKRAALASIESDRAEWIALSDQIWRWAETSLLETNSAKELSDRAERLGFAVQRGVAQMPTAFIASYGSGRPIIGIVGEYDALPGLSQKATVFYEPREEGAPGHGCGHNLFGVGSLAAASAIKELIAAKKLSGTIRYYGTPAEERFGGKSYMARAGLFADLDVCLAWHPSDRTRATATTGQALVDIAVDFRGRASHAAVDPWNGRSALDALELFTHGLNLLREHVKPTVRIHYTIQQGGDVPNIVPERARLWCWLRDATYPGVEEVLTRVRAMAQGAGLMAGVESKLTVQEGVYERLINQQGLLVLHTNLVWVGAPVFTDEEQQFARAIQRSSRVKDSGLRTVIDPVEGQEFEGGSTDLGDVSYLAPLLHLDVACAPFEAPWHAWPVVACGGMSIGHKGMLQAAKALAATMVDLFEHEPIRRAIRQEFEAKTKGITYRAMIPDGPPPINRARGQ